MAELAEGARLLSECTVKSRTEGSNPSLSARAKKKAEVTKSLGLFALLFLLMILLLDRQLQTSHTYAHFLTDGTGRLQIFRADTL